MELIYQMYRKVFACNSWEVLLTKTILIYISTVLRNPAYFKRTDAQKRGLILRGKTNSGKSTFADTFCYYYPHYSIGYFFAPEVIGSNNVLLMKLPRKHMYRGDEIIIENFTALQRFKKLAENCNNLETDVKYKEAVHVTSRPTTITCNGDKPGDLCPHFSSKIDAIKNRCFFIMMRKTLSERIPVNHIPILLESDEYILDIMYRFYEIRYN